MDRSGTRRRQTDSARVDTHEPRTTRHAAARSRRPRGSSEPSERASELGRELREGRLGNFPSRNDHEIERQLARLHIRAIGPQSEQLAHAPFCTIAEHRVSQAAGGDDAQPVAATRIRQCEHRQKSGLNPAAPFAHGIELGARPQAPFRAMRQRHRGDDGHVSAFEDGPSLEQLSGIRRRRSTVCGLWPDGASGQCARSSCASEQETHGCGGGADDWAEKYVSLDSRPGLDTLEKLES